MRSGDSDAPYTTGYFLRMCGGTRSLSCKHWVFHPGTRVQSPPIRKRARSVSKQLKIKNLEPRSVSPADPALSNEECETGIVEFEQYWAEIEALEAAEYSHSRAGTLRSLLLFVFVLFLIAGAVLLEGTNGYGALWETIGRL